MSIISNKRQSANIHFFIFCFVVLLPFISGAQNNGNALFLQGLTERNPQSAKGCALGQAYCARSGDLNTMFYNSAGLADIQSLQVSISASSKQRLWRENQDWFPGSGYLNTNLYFEGLWEPNPAWDGLWASELMSAAYDTAANPIEPFWDEKTIKTPVMGKDVYSKEAAEHEKKADNLGFDQLSLAVPIKVFGKSIVVAASYNRQIDLYDYDWNGSHLDPHWGTSTIFDINEGDTTRTNWSVFTRQRTGNIYSYRAALAFKPHKYVQLGLGFRIFSSASDDLQRLDRIGYILTEHENDDWMFSHEKNDDVIKGTSTFKTTAVNVGALFTTEQFNLGLNVSLPYTLERTWDYTRTIIEAEQQSSIGLSGVDKTKMPATYRLGMSFRPSDDLNCSLDFEKTDYSKAEYEPAQSGLQDSLTQYTGFVDQSGLHLGIEYKLNKYISLLVGYQSISAPFIPYGVAIRDKGFPEHSYSVGTSLETFLGRFDVAYMITTLKYYDAFHSARYYTLQQSKIVLFGYSLNL